MEKKKTEEEEEATSSGNNSVEASIGSVLSELDGIFTVKGRRTAPKAFVGGHRGFTLLPNNLKLQLLCRCYADDIQLYFSLKPNQMDHLNVLYDSVGITDWMDLTVLGR